MNQPRIICIKHFFVLLFALLAIVQVGRGQAATDYIEKIDELISTYSEYGRFNGSVLVAEQGAVIYKKGFGLANVEWDRPNQPDTKHRLASITKQFTAMLVLQLVAENKLALDVPISAYLPDYPEKQGDQITVHHLLTHTSGTPNYTSFSNYQEMKRKPMRPEELVHLFADSALHFTPGERFRYSNSGYILLGVIIEKITKKSYEQVLQDRIFIPLDMNNSGIDHPGSMLKNRSSGYYRNGSNFRPANYIDMSTAFAAGAIYSTVEDLYLWDQALYNSILIPQKYLDLLFTKHIGAGRNHYGYGWDVGEMRVGKTDDRIQMVQHSGGINGFNTLITRMPSHKRLVVLLNNTASAPLREMTQAINGILQGKPYAIPQKSMAESLSAIVKKEGIPNGIAYFMENKNSDNYYLDENEINMAGYGFLQNDKLDEAVALFKLNVETFPHSANVYDSYAEALLLLGDEAQAIEHYKTSVKLNPDNEHGISVLKKLGADFEVKRKEDLFFLQSDSPWRKEIFHFPLSFANDIKFEGIEDARFPEGWEVQESPNFWSYVYAWNIDLQETITEKQLAENLQKYFDGLMRIKKSDNNLPGKVPTIALFQKNKGANGHPKFTGTIKTFDNFFTKKPLMFYVQVDQQICEKNNKSIILFQFSPKEFGHDTWDKLGEVLLPEDACE